VIPVHNEASTITQILRELAAYPELTVLVVDDASTDDSLRLIRQHGVHVLPLHIKLGAWGAMQAGIRYARTQGYERVLTMDGDGQHHSEEIPNLLLTMEQRTNADVVIGACTERGSRLRLLAWRFFRFITGVGIEDITSGFRLYNRKAVELLAGNEATLLEYQDVGVLLMLKSAGLRIVETPVRMTPRTNGISRIYSSWFMVFYYMMVTTILSLCKAGPKRRSQA
jgi:hypothetical protein